RPPLRHPRPARPIRARRQQRLLARPAPGRPPRRAQDLAARDPRRLPGHGRARLPASALVRSPPHDHRARARPRAPGAARRPARAGGRAAAARPLRRPDPSMSTQAELAHLFRTLKAPAAARALPKLAERARAEEWSYERFAEVLLQTEVASRDAHGGEARIKQARFPARKTLEEFDFSFQRSVQKTLVLHLGQLDFLTAKDNVVLLGPSGPGSHCPPRRRHCANSPAA